MSVNTLILLQCTNDLSRCIQKYNVLTIKTVASLDKKLIETIYVLKWGYQQSESSKITLCKSHGPPLLSSSSGSFQSSLSIRHFWYGFRNSELKSLWKKGNNVKVIYLDYNWGGRYPIHKNIFPIKFKKEIKECLSSFCRSDLPYDEHGDTHSTYQKVG